MPPKYFFKNAVALSAGRTFFTSPSTNIQLVFWNHCSDHTDLVLKNDSRQFSEQYSLEIISSGFVLHFFHHKIPLRFMMLMKLLIMRNKFLYHTVWEPPQGTVSSLLLHWSRTNQETLEVVPVRAQDVCTGYNEGHKGYASLSTCHSTCCLRQYHCLTSLLTEMIMLSCIASLIHIVCLFLVSK